ncbi:glycosyl hydrolase 115 family protein [Neobacillus cucumis]|uniref:glycosyl hydrolase 115 family protein n=1 Tax=Neobacillus cucumis TaxID=1740721 RepID=UPI002E2214AC|nr:glycosyl hydrolase 115 family protein [Neobacillus cucumis]
MRYAIDMIVRDQKKVFGKPPILTTSPEAGPNLIIRYASKEDEGPDWTEGFAFRFSQQNEKWVMHIIGNDDLGIIYGLLHYSRHYLGVDPFWFWADLSIEPRTQIKIPVTNYNSARSKVRNRGWFVNDEVCLIGWKEEYPPMKEVWFPVFEALLRCGGNMVIPGTDLPRHGIHADLAAEMGLWVTHHHAEPLGAEMFSRAYPGKKPNYQENPELFENLWKEAIEKQKHQKIIWVLSFRGQGDAPFWQNAPEFDTPEKRGDMISKVVERQYELVRKSVEQPVCCMALYEEIAELYKEGYIRVPDGVIKIWADNGYGKMVSRRQNNENLRIPSLPDVNDPSEHGIYYHITFHDLQASNHLTMFPAPTEMIIEEVEKAFDAGAHSYLLLNSGNIRPHLYPLDLISQLWSKGTENQDKHLEEFIHRLYRTHNKQIQKLYQSYANLSIRYGEHRDDKAGEEFYHHLPEK